MLAEARGYRLSLVLAHQHLGQLGPDLADGVSANARSKVFFTTSPEDARRLERHVAPRLTAHDLAHLDGYQAAARLLVDNRRTPAFTLRTRPLGPPIPGRADAARAAAAHNTTTQTTDTAQTTEILDTTETPGTAPPGTRARPGRAQSSGTAAARPQHTNARATTSGGRATGTTQGRCRQAGTERPGSGRPGPSRPRPEPRPDRRPRP